MPWMMEENRIECHAWRFIRSRNREIGALLNSVINFAFVVNTEPMNACGTFVRRERTQDTFFGVE